MASISSLFGYILNFIYSFVQNYGLSIIILSILLKLALLPLSIKQQKTMKKTAKIQGKVKEIQEKYKNDQSKMNQEMMDLYKKENMSPFSGCLSTIIQLLILLAMFGLVRNPLTYMLKIDQYTVNSIANYIVLENNEENKIDRTYPQISILKYVSKNKDKVIDLNKIENNKEEQKNEDENKENIIDKNEENTINTTIENNNNMENTETGVNEDNKEENNIYLKDLYLNMNFLGLDLSNIPKENWNDITVFIIPALYVLTSIASLKLTTMLTNKNKEKNPIDTKKDIKGEEDKEENLSPEEMSEQMGKSMTWFMPILSVSISLIAPLGLALYWLVNNVLMIIERLVLNKIIEQEEEEKQNG